MLVVLSPVFALMPTINCLLGYPGTSSTCYICSFLLTVNSITVFVTICHNHQLPDQTSTVNDNNFIIRMLYNY